MSSWLENRVLAPWAQIAFSLNLELLLTSFHSSSFFMRQPEEPKCTGHKHVFHFVWLYFFFSNVSYPRLIYAGLCSLWASLVAQMAKNMPAMQKTWVPSLSWEDPLEKRMATSVVYIMCHNKVK